MGSTFKWPGVVIFGAISELPIGDADQRDGGGHFTQICKVMLYLPAGRHKVPPEPLQFT